MSATEARRRFLPDADEIAVVLVAPGESVEVVTVRGVKVVTHPDDDGLDGVAMVPGSSVELGWGLVELHFESGGGVKLERGKTPRDRPTWKAAGVLLREYRAVVVRMAPVNYFGRPKMMPVGVRIPAQALDGRWQR